LYRAINKQENAQPEAWFLVAGVFIAGNLKSVLPNFYQHVTCATRGDKTLNHMYKAPSLPPFDKSDHNSILLLSAYKQKLKQEVPVLRSIWKRFDIADTKLQDCLASTDWNMFRDSYDNIEEFTTSVTSFINNCIDDVVPTVTVRTYPSHKLQATVI
jgi:hypothetical protein